MGGTLNKKIASKKADVYGRAFETMFEYMCQRNGIAVTRIPDGCKVVQGGRKLIRVRSPFDWIVSAKHGNQPITLLCDTKTTQESTFPNSKINRHQVDELRKHEANGLICGYVIEFRELRSVYFFPALVLAAAEGRGSLQPSGILLGSSQAFDVRKIFTPSHLPADSHFPGRITT